MSRDTSEPGVGAREDIGALAKVLREGPELAYDNIHADWARESIARTILSSSWLAAHDERVRAAERERLAAMVTEEFAELADDAEEWAAVTLEAGAETWPDR